MYGYQHDYILTIQVLSYGIWEWLLCKHFFCKHLVSLNRKKDIAVKTEELKQITIIQNLTSWTFCLSLKFEMPNLNKISFRITHELELRRKKSFNLTRKRSQSLGTATERHIRAGEREATKGQKKKWNGEGKAKKRRRRDKGKKKCQRKSLKRG